jgi:glutathione S-transferase
METILKPYANHITSEQLFVMCRGLLRLHKSPVSPILMSMKTILYSFRRCPYAMRARLALTSAAIPLEHREILLRDKPSEMLKASPKGTVPVLVTDGKVIDESLDIMLWALSQNDPEHWLDVPPAAHTLIAEADGRFKSALDTYKYASRFPEIDATENRTNASVFLFQINGMLRDTAYLNGTSPSLADMAIAPFVRQFAHVDLDWFNAQPWPNLARWLSDFKASERFLTIMAKHPVWSSPP